MRGYPATRYRCQRSGTPFSSCSPASSNVGPDPATRSFTVERRAPRRARPCDAILAPIETARPLHLASTSWNSPVWMPARIVDRRVSPARPEPTAHRTARAGPSKRGEEAVPGGVPLGARCRANRSLTTLVVPLAEVLPRSVSDPALRRGRTHDVGEQEGGEGRRRFLDAVQARDEISDGGHGALVRVVVEPREVALHVWQLHTSPRGGCGGKKLLGRTALRRGEQDQRRHPYGRQHLPDVGRPIIIRKNAAAAPGLRLRRMCVTNQSQNFRVVRHGRSQQPVRSLPGNRARPSARARRAGCLLHSASDGAQG